MMASQASCYKHTNVSLMGMNDVYSHEITLKYDEVRLRHHVVMAANSFFYLNEGRRR